MTGQLVRSSRRGRELRWSLVHVAAALLALAGVEAVLVAAGPGRPVWTSEMFPLLGCVYLAVGVVAWWRRPSSGIGAILVAGSLAALLAGLVNTAYPALIAVGQVTALLIVAILVHLLLSFPTGRLSSGWARRLVVAVYVVALVLEAPEYLFTSAPAPYDTLQIGVHPGLVAAGGWVRSSAALLVTGLTAAVLVRRLRAMAPASRRRLLPLYAYGVVSVVSIPLSSVVVAPLLGWEPIATFVAQMTLLALVPVAFTLSLVRGAMPRTSSVEDLGTWLGAEQTGRPALREALATTLGDPSLELAFWSPERGRYVDAVGRPVDLSEAASGRATVEIAVVGQRVGAINYETTSIDDPELVRAAGRVVAIAADRDRLIADLRDKQDALLRSRRRIVEAGDRERRRIERNLHDGAQQRLMGLALALRLAEARVNGTDPAVGSLMAEASTELDGAMRDLRDLAHGLHPLLLSGAGLGAAIEALAERSPIPVDLSMGILDAIPEPIQVAAYYVVAEALTNAAKHSGSSHIVVRAEDVGRSLHVEVRDDGGGGARAQPGSGLEGLLDRVDSMGGSFELLSPLAGGTRIVADFPCG